MCACARNGAKKQCRRKYSPKAQRLARPVVIVLAFVIANAFSAKGIYRIAKPWMKDSALQEFALQVF
jgi:hypothetical protein